MSEYTVRPITYTAGYLTAYGAAKQGGYTGTYEEFCAAIAGLEGIVEDLNNFSVVVSTLAAGSSATASYADGVLTLGIPKGDKGDQGDQGIPGEVQDNIIADEFSSSTAYTKGTMVMKESVLYRFTADHAAGAWTGSDAETVQIGEELTGINEDVSDLKENINSLWVTDTASGAIASFPDGADNVPVKDLTVSIEPVQSGSGNPSPSNVRPITGWTGANVVVSPTEDAQDGTTYTINWQTEAGTVYGGTLDVTTGVLTVDKEGKVFDSSNIDTALSYGSGYLTVSVKPSITQLEKPLSTWQTPVYCSHYKCGGNSGIRITGSNNHVSFWCKPQNLTDPTQVVATVNEDNIEDYRNYFKQQATNGTPLTVVWEIKVGDPVTYQLDPTEVKTLLGQNNIWADTGDSSVEYRADTKLYIQKMLSS